MTGLLVSVRDQVEAQAAMAGGADLIDIKEPRRGALGAADWRVWRAVRGVAGADRPLSVALGELRFEDVRMTARKATGIQFAKIGLAGCRELPDWRQRWQAAVRCLPRETIPVAVVYADHASAAAPSPAAVLDQAVRIGCRALLVDTYDKSLGNLFSHLSLRELGALSRAAREQGFQVVLAGSLDAPSMRVALQLAPDYLAVRRAACQGDRTGHVCREQVRHLVALIAGADPAIITSAESHRFA